MEGRDHQGLVHLLREHDEGAVPLQLLQHGQDAKGGQGIDRGVAEDDVEPAGGERLAQPGLVLDSGSLGDVPAAPELLAESIRLGFGVSDDQQAKQRIHAATPTTVEGRRSAAPAIEVKSRFKYTRLSIRRPVGRSTDRTLPRAAFP
jgi:hypothetical protein